MDLSKIKKLFEDFGISQSAVAKKMNMNENTFRLKFNDNNPQYKFRIDGKVDEIGDLCEVLRELGEQAIEASKRGFDLIEVGVEDEDLKIAS